MTGLNGLVPYYDYALDMVLDVEMPMEDSLTEVRQSWCTSHFYISFVSTHICNLLWNQDQQEIVESAAEMLYGLIHAR